jgi:parallel beta helix pectate lyase-like protein/Big-like domain-containing protein
MNTHSILVRAGLALLVLGSWTFMLTPGVAAQATQPGFAILASKSSPVTGVVRLTADVVDEPGLVGVYFRVDGYVQERIQTGTPYDIWWSAASATNGEHTITARARYASGAWIESAPLRLTVANPVAFNRTLYADAASGDDANDGLAPSTAWRTLDRANQAVAAGDTVLLQGTFTGQRIAPNVSGTVGRPIKFTSYAGTTAVLDVGVAGRAVLLDAGRSYIVIEQLRIQNVPGYAIEITAGANHNVVRDTYITGSGNAAVWGHGVRITQSSDNVVEGNQILDTGDEPANSGDSVWIADGSSRNRVLNNRLTNGGHSLIQIGGDQPADAPVTDNVVARNVMSNRWATPLILSWRAQWTIVEYNRISDGARNGVNTPRAGVQIQASDNIIRYNEVFDNTGAAIYIVGYGFRPAGQDSVIGQDSIGNSIYFNVFYGNGIAPDPRPDQPTATAEPAGADRAGLAILMFEQDGRTVRDNFIACNIFYRNSGFRFGDAIYSIVFDHFRAVAWPEGTLNGNRIVNNIILRDPASAGEVAVLRIRRPEDGANVSYTLAQFDDVHPEAANNLEVDPRFTDEANRVFTLREDSPALAACR